MKQLENVDIRAWNTFRVRAVVRAMLLVEEEQDFDDLPLVLGSLPAPFLVMGGGSNLLFCHDYPGTVVKVVTQGIEVAEEDRDTVLLSVAAGVEWETLVNYCLERGYGGIENLTMIPGLVGSAVVQNIGAYGVEVKDVVEKVAVVSLRGKGSHLLYNADCAFGYRRSLFKTSYPDKYLIKRVFFRLRKAPVVNLSYGSLSRELAERGLTHPDIGQVASVIRAIRAAKLPDVEVLGSAGSFFKNPEVSEETYRSLQMRYPSIPGYPLPQGGVKLAAGWLIEKAGWKGYRSGDAGVYPQQALVLVNYGEATGKEIYALSEEIRQNVKQRFGIALEREVQVIGEECK
ncbi:MAG: UDP-N-acetylenolpyruvoylglucosamine reductase [Bacteroidetes bacterium]|nr:MAG: UDP-N-acetylenolpyruvoylglucosamine reductase [Bacteroidota bacterium]